MAGTLNAGSVVAQFKADIAGMKQGISQVKSQVSSLKGGFMAAGESMANAGQMIIKATALVGAGLATAGGFAVKSAADFEQTKIALTTMMGSAEDAGNLLQEISKFAAETPFELPELATTTKQLMAFGFSASEAVTGMKTLGDISAGLNVPIGDLAYLLGTLKAQGRAMTIDIRQFAMRGLPIYDALADVMGVAKEKVSDLVTEGKVGFPEVNKALESMVKEGGKFHGSMAAQATSLKGLYSTLSDTVGFALREIIGINLKGEVREGSIFDILRQKAQIFIAYLDANKEKIAAFVGNLVNRIGTMAQQIWAFIQPAMEVLGKLFAYLNQNNDLVVGIFVAIGLAIAAAAIAFLAAHAVMILVFTAIVAAVVFARKAWEENWGGIQEKVAFFVDYFKLVVSIVKYVFDMVTSLMAGFYLFFTGQWGALWELTKDTLETAKDDLLNIFKNLWETAKSFFDAFYSHILGKFGELWEKAKQIAHDIREAIASAFDKDKRNSPSIADRVKELSNFVSSQSQAFRPVIQPAVAGNNYQQTVTNYINTPVDADQLSDRLAFRFRSMS